MNTIVAYRIDSARTAEELERKVNRSLDEGWQPLGHPFPVEGDIGQASVMTSDGKRMRKTSED